MQGKKQALIGECGIACAVIARAAKDLAEGNGHSEDAREFLTGTWAAALLSGACAVLAIDDIDTGDLARLAGAQAETSLG